MKYLKILCVVLFASFLVACHQISSGTVVDKYIDEPHTTFIPESKEMENEHTETN